MNILKEALLSLEEVLYPEACRVCFKRLVKGELGLCTGCFGELPRTHFVLNSGNPVERIFWGRGWLDMASSFLSFNKTNPTRKLMHQIKYEGNKELAVELGKIYASELMSSGGFDGADILLPIPLHPTRLKLRGYNQSTEFAKGMAEVFGAEVNEEIIKRIHNNESQTKKQRFERWVNVADKFTGNNLERLANKKVFLVDDVVTTGATIEACMKTITEAKPAILGVLTLAIASN